MSWTTTAISSSFGNATGSVGRGCVSTSLDERPTAHMAVHFGKLAQFAGQVKFLVLQLELTKASPDIGLDVGDPAVYFSLLLRLRQLG